MGKLFREHSLAWRMIRAPIKTILISRVDNLGDAVLLYPAAGILKKNYPDTRLLFLGQRYQRAIIQACSHFDGFLNWDEVKHEPLDRQAAFFKDNNIDVIVHAKPRRPIAVAAKKAKIPHRIGSFDRVFHLTTCNHLPIQVRRWSKLHEAQLNIRLLSPLLEKTNYPLDELASYLGFHRIKHHDAVARRYLSTGKFNLILHPRSLGHAKEWDVKHFAGLIDLLPIDQYNILVTGTKQEGETLKEALLEPYKHRICDLTGRLSIRELISLISCADGLVAASTGPLHIAAAAGIYALGLYVQKWQLHPGRYAPIGARASAMVYDEHCPTCLADKECDCINLITAERVFAKMSTWSKL